MHTLTKSWLFCMGLNWLMIEINLLFLVNEYSDLSLFSWILSVVVNSEYRTISMFIRKYEIIIK